MKNIRSIVLVTIALTTFVSYGADGKPTVEQLVNSHLESIGRAEVRSATRLQKLQGTVDFSEIVGGRVHLNGSASLISQHEKVKCVFQFGVPQYVGEQFVFDGNMPQVAMTDASNRSRLGQFLFTQSEILRDGIWGGTLSTAWPLLDLTAKQPLLKYSGLKKIAGRDLHEVRYVPKKRSGSGDLSIRIYFDPITFQHVMTTYKLVVHDAKGSIQNGDDEIAEIVEERFSDFQDVNGANLPSRWQIQYRRTPGDPTVLQWDVRFALKDNQN